MIHTVTTNTLQKHVAYSYDPRERVAQSPNKQQHIAATMTSIQLQNLTAHELQTKIRPTHARAKCDPEGTPDRTTPKQATAYSCNNDQHLAAQSNNTHKNCPHLIQTVGEF